jgi:hypothetical protein
MIARLGSASNADAPIEQRIVERTAAGGVIAPRPVVRKEAAKQESDFRDRWRNYHFAVTNNVKSALSAVALASRIRLAQLHAHALSLFRSLSGQFPAWRNKNWNVIKIDFKWRDFASSCLRWLRAPSHTPRRRHALPKPHGSAPQTESSAPIPATQPLRSHPLPRTSRSQFIRSLENAPRVTTSILQWLQEPNHSVRERKSTPASDTHLP